MSTKAAVFNLAPTSFDFGVNSEMLRLLANMLDNAENQGWTESSLLTLSMTDEQADFLYKLMKRSDDSGIVFTPQMFALYRQTENMLYRH